MSKVNNNVEVSLLAREVVPKLIRDEANQRTEMQAEAASGDLDLWRVDKLDVRFLFFEPETDGEGNVTNPGFYSLDFNVKHEGGGESVVSFHAPQGQATAVIRLAQRLGLKQQVER